MTRKYNIFSLAAAAILALAPTIAPAQTVGTYQEDNGAVRNNVGVVVSGPSAATAATPPATSIQIGGQYNNSYPVLTSGQYGALRIDYQGGLIVTPSAAVTPSDAYTNNGFVGMRTTSNTSAPGLSALYVYNGTTWDRQRGDVNGTVVQPALSTTFWNYSVATGGIVNTATALTVKSAAGGGVRNYVCSITISHDTLGGPTEFAIRDGAAGTVMFRTKLQAAAKESDSTITFSPCLRGTASTLVEVVTLTAVTGGVFASLQGYTGT